MGRVIDSLRAHYACGERFPSLKAHFIRRGVEQELKEGKKVTLILQCPSLLPKYNISQSNIKHNLFFELFPLQSFPFTFLCSQAVKKLLHFSLSFRIPKNRRGKKENKTH